MEIDARFPTIQATQTTIGGAPGEDSAPSVSAEAGSEFFISPVLRFDSRSLTVIFQVRDSRNGDVIRQFPPETVVARYRQDPSAKPFVLPTTGAAEARDLAELEIITPHPGSGDDPATASTRGDAAPGDPAPEAVDLVA